MKINIFYGHGDTKTPMYTSIINLVVNVIGNLIFISLWGINGLALSTSTSAMISFAFRMIFVRKYINISFKDISWSLIKIIIISIVSCIIPKLLMLKLSVNIYLEACLSALIGICFFIVLARLLNLNELKDLVSLIRKKIGS